MVKKITSRKAEGYIPMRRLLMRNCGRLQMPQKKAVSIIICLKPNVTYQYSQDLFDVPTAAARCVHHSEEEPDFKS